MGWWFFFVTWNQVSCPMIEGCTGCMVMSSAFRRRRSTRLCKKKETTMFECGKSCGAVHSAKNRPRHSKGASTIRTLAMEKKARSLKRIGKLLPSPVSHYCKRLGGHFLIPFPRMRNTRMCPFSSVCKKKQTLRPSSVRSGAMLTIGRRAVEKKYFSFWPSSPISFPKGIIKNFPYPFLQEKSVGA